MTNLGRFLIHKFVYLFSSTLFSRVLFFYSYLRSYSNLSSISSLFYSTAFLWNQIVALWFSVFYVYLFVV